MDQHPSVSSIYASTRDGAEAEKLAHRPHIAVANNPAHWASKYGSLVTTICGVGTADGFDEKAFAAHRLYLVATDFGPRDETKLGVQASLREQCLLDNAATVDEALNFVNEIQPVMVSVDNMKSTVHLATEDAG